MDYLLPIAMAALTLTGILLGYRVAFVLGGSAGLFILVSELPASYFGLIMSRIYANVLSNWLLVAIPMFIFMGLVLERSGVAERTLRAAQSALGGTPAGMGIAVIVVGIMLAAASGIVGASVVLLALIALPRLLENGYDKKTSAGLIASSGTVAILIPPSVMLIVLADQLNVSVGAMFTAALVPGLLLMALYSVYILFKSAKLPRVANAVQKRPALARLVLDMAPLLLLVVFVLGAIVSGTATPTEASGLGALGAMLISLLYRQFSIAMIMQCARETIKSTSMVMLVMIGATCFAAVFHGVGGHAGIESAFDAVNAGPWVVLLIIMSAIFFLGFVLDWLEITLILMPIFGPLIAAMDFGNGLEGSALLIWFGILVAVNMQSSFLTPPFGFSLFYLRGAASSTLSTRDIYAGVVPFVGLQLFALLLMAIFPKIVVGVI